MLAEGLVPQTIDELIGEEIEVIEERFVNARDAVCYCFFDGGGMISYKKTEGYLHTLCDEPGMKRKLKSLRCEDT